MMTRFPGSLTVAAVLLENPDVGRLFLGGQTVHTG